ncbi:hypothetical protein BHE18_19305 [Rossellomorea aquimaris]|uniref:Uncharacterized protein n=1 Tax=Rossellomorea aquimaris TaxID=189382 RepID=A0A1J6VXV8_9BACI|nr:hypothetical protein BHE18_19305 [Rossellomorea aquimaris]
MREEQLIRKAEGLWSEAGGILRIVHEGVLCLSLSVWLMTCASKPLAGQVRLVQLLRLEARRHESINPKRQKEPFRLARLMFVVSGRPASTFLPAGTK